MTLELLPLDDTFAREVRGIDLWQCAHAEAGDAIREAFAAHPVLVFRRQALSEDELLTFGHTLGTPRRYVERSWWSNRPEVSVVSNMRNGAGELIGGLSSRELNWHTDQSYNAVPVTGCFLYAQVIPADGSRTSWANLYGAYEALPAATKEIIDGAVGTFSYAARTRSVIPNADARVVQQSYDERIRATPDVRHPLVHTHPVTGRKALYMDPGTLVAVDGMPDDEASALFDELLSHATREGNVYHHRWQVGDLVLWDNAVTLHRRDAFADDQNRLLKRMIISLDEGSHITPMAV
jgi:alpha-ketoglutarate-dependent taurine dioxygenase